VRRFLVSVEVEVDLGTYRQGSASAVEKVAACFRDKLSGMNYHSGSTLSFSSSEILSVVSLGRDSDAADVAADINGVING
jgi:hypothetical protein